MAAHTLLGYLLAVRLAGAAAGEGLGTALLGLLLWVVCLNGGTLALNSAFDRDEGDIAYLRAPPAPPEHLAAWGFGLMVVGQGAAFLLPPMFRLAYGVCLILSVLYSVPPFRLKAVAGADWLINMVGFGTFTPLAGWVTTGRPLDGAHFLVLLGFCPLFAALYPLTQIYQVDEDRRRGDQTLVIRLGVGRSLWVAIGAALIAFACFAISLAWLGLVTPWRVVAVGIGFVSWMGVLLPWALRHRALTGPQHQLRMYLALAAWAVTDVAVLLAWGTWHPS